MPRSPRPPGPRTCTDPARGPADSLGQPPSSCRRSAERDCCHPSCPTQGPWGQPMPHLQPWPLQGPACPACLPAWLPASPCPLPGHPRQGPPGGSPSLLAAGTRLKTCPDLSSRRSLVQNNPELLLQELFPWDLPGDGDTVSRPGHPHDRPGGEAGGPKLGPRVMGGHEHLWGSV